MPSEGYASGTIGGACTRRFHGQLIAALPAPAGRLMMFNHIEEAIAMPDGRCLRLSGDEQGGERAIAFPEPDLLEEFSMEGGLPVWRFSRAGLRLEKRLFMPHEQNTTYIIYKLLEGPPGLALNIRPSLHFRPHEGLLNTEVPRDWSVVRDGRDLEIRGGEKFPALRLALLGRDADFRERVQRFDQVLYRNAPAGAACGVSGPDCRGIASLNALPSTRVAPRWLPLGVRHIERSVKDKLDHVT